MKICYFGTYEKDYPLNSIIIKGLKKNGVEVIECHASLWEKHRNKHGDFLKLFSLLKLALSLIISYLKLSFKFLKECKNVETVVVGYIGQLDIFWLKFLILFRKNKPQIIFIPLVSLYDTAIVDRGLSGKKNVFAKLLFYIDKFSFEMSDLVVLDTDEHIKYICGLFKLNIKKFRKVWVGADEEVFYPIESKSNGGFTVLFFGKYIPLHGLEYIIKAAKLLESEKDIKLRMIGSGQLYDEITGLSETLNLKNIEFVEWVEYDKLLNEINKADAVLGIFGGTEKSSRVIPNKVFQAIACRKPVITGDSPAIRELFTDQENIMLCENRNAESLKNAILELRNNNELRGKIANNSYVLFQRDFSSEKIGKIIAKFIARLKNKA